jgi:DNA-binding response OmpR family regulator
MKPLEIELLDKRRPTLERVLVVDDDKSVRESLTEVLICEGYMPAQAANGEEALQILDTQRIDLILLDLNMPRLNGWDTFEKLIERWPLIPILIITARPNQLFLAASAGAAGLLEKPVDIPAMIGAIRTALEEPTSVRLERLAGSGVNFTFATGHESLSKG